MTIRMDARIRRNEDIVFGEHEGELALLNIESGDHFGLNETGARIWELIETAPKVDELIATLGREFEAPEDALRAEVLAFLERMVESRVALIAGEAG